MAIIIKTEDQIKLIRESCRLLAIVHKELEEMIRPGITTREIDIRGDSLIRKLGDSEFPPLQWISGEHLRVCER